MHPRTAPQYISLRLSRTIRPSHSQPPCCSRARFSNNTSRPNALHSYGTSEYLSRKQQLQADPLKPLRKNQDAPSERTRLMRRSKIATGGIVACALCMVGAVWWYDQLGSTEKPKRVTTLLDGPAMPRIPTAPIGTVVVDDDTTRVPTGTSTIPFFPRTIQLSSSRDPSLTTDILPTSPSSATSTGTNTLPTPTAPQETTYQLLGLGLRTVSFLRIQVYVVGIYIAVPDIATLQLRLLRQLDPVATTLVPRERERLKELLLDPVQGERIWDEILRDGGIRTVVRVVPTRNTDFMHLRDGFVRAVTGRSGERERARKSVGAGVEGEKEQVLESFDDEAFGESIASFKAIWGGAARKGLKKGDTLLLTRDQQGAMGAWVEDKEKESDQMKTKDAVVSTRLRLGGVEDERISRLIWLGYLAGKNVSSETARVSVVDGVMDLVERPVGTVAQQVHV